MTTGWWVTDYLQGLGPQFLAAYVFWVIVSITLHELAHGWVATWQGDDTPRLSGHLTINPIVHMGWQSLFFFAITGMAWGQMPVNPNRFRSGRRGDLLVSAAGPAMNLVLAFLALTVLAVLRAKFSIALPKSNLFQFLFMGGWLNLGLLIFNLIPVPPLDGSRMLATVSLTMYRLMHTPFLQSFGIFVVIIGMRVLGLTDRMWLSGQRLSLWWEGIVYGLLS